MMGHGNPTFPTPLAPSCLIVCRTIVWDLKREIYACRSQSNAQSFNFRPWCFQGPNSSAGLNPSWKHVSSGNLHHEVEKIVCNRFDRIFLSLPSSLAVGAAIGTMFCLGLKPVQHHTRIQIRHKAFVIFGIGWKFTILASEGHVGIAGAKLGRTWANAQALLHVSVFLQSQAHTWDPSRVSEFMSPGFDPSVEINEGQDGNIYKKFKHLHHRQHRWAKPETPLASHVGHDCGHLGKNQNPENVNSNVHRIIES